MTNKRKYGGGDDPGELADALAADPSEPSASSPSDGEAGSADSGGGSAAGLAPSSSALSQEELAKQMAEAPPTPSDEADDKTPRLASGALAPGQAQPQAIADAAARIGGEPPRAAPKGGEGVNATVREVAHPELEAPSPAVEYRVAPIASDQINRESFGADKPKFEDVKNAYTVEVQTVDERSAGFFSGGVFIGPQPLEVLVASVIDRSEGHLRQLLSDPRIELRIKQ